MTGEAQGKQLTCVDCGVQFLFTDREQAFYEQRGYSTPRRCKTCRDKRKAGQPAQPEANPGNSHGHSHSHSQKEHAAPGRPHAAAATAENTPGGPAQFKVNCTTCGAETTVPFKPNPSRPVYCRTCYLASRKGR